MIEQFNPTYGRYILIDYTPYNPDEEKWEQTVKNIRVRIQNLGSADIAEDIATDYAEIDVPGRPKVKSTMKIFTLPINGVGSFTIGSKVFDVDEQKMYFVTQIGKGYDSIHMLNRLQWNNRKMPAVLFLGERR